MVIADTGFWVAASSPRDKHHSAATSWLRQNDERLITTWPVITETCQLLAHRVGRSTEQAFLAGYAKDAFEVFLLGREHIPPLVVLMDKYRDLPMDLADASVVLLAEELGHGRILATDQRHLRTYRWKHRKPFENLLIP